jgi:hypothetical protein
MSDLFFLWLATTVCHSSPQMRDWVPPAVVDLPQTHPAFPAKGAKRSSTRRRRALMQKSATVSHADISQLQAGEVYKSGMPCL